MSPILLTLVLLSAPAPAATIYQCKLANGTVVFQDRPCTQGRLMKSIVVPSGPKTPPPAPTNPAPAPPPATPAPNDATAPTPPPQTSHGNGRYYKCTSHDESTYFSASPVPKRHLVPVWVIKDQSFVPTNPAVGSDPRVWVEDRCVEVDVAEACRHYREQIELIEGQMGIGAGDPKKQAREITRLTTITKARCGG